MSPIDLLIKVFDSWSPERQEEIIELVKRRMQERHEDFTDEELDNQFEEEDDGNS
jgi:hypothetical protein